MKKVLLVTPGGAPLAGYRSVLERDELRIVVAATAGEGLRILREERVDLVLTELDLPDMGGDELCSLVRRDDSLKAVFLVVVCGAEPESLERADCCPANARLVKPVTPEQLNDSVGRLLSVPTRQDCRVLVRARVYGEHGATTLFCTTRNISVSGLLLESDDHLAIGDRLSCLFFLPGARQISAVGEVVRTNPLSRMIKQYGIRFISLCPEAQAEIAHFVAAGVAA